MPSPMTLSNIPPGALIEKGTRSRIKSNTSDVVAAEMEMAVVFETSKVAKSAGPFGTVFGIQLVAVFQSPALRDESPSRTGCTVLLGNEQLSYQPRQEDDY